MGERERETVRGGGAMRRVVGERGGGEIRNRKGREKAE